MMEKQEKLTADQELQVFCYRERYWRQATSTEPAIRQWAEAVAKRLVEIGGVKAVEVKWVNCPTEAATAYKTAWASLRASLRASLWASLRASLGDSLGASLSDSLRDSLWASLWDSLRASLGASLWDSLRDSLWDSLWDSGWLCYYSYAVEVLGIECSDKHRELLNLHNEIAASCFALWIAPGKVILCERPAAVEIKDGKLVGLTWRE